MGFREGDMDGVRQRRTLLRNDEIAMEYARVDGLPRAFEVILSTRSNGRNAATAPRLFSQ